MNRRQIYFTIALLALAAGIVCLLWPRKTNQPVLHLQMVRQTEEEGKPVVFFRVQAADRRAFLIRSVGRVVGERTVAMADIGLGRPNDFWAPSQAWPMLDPKEARQEFGVLAVTNVPVWKLRVRVAVEERSPLKRLISLPSTWKLIRGQQSILVAIKDTWNVIYYTREQEIESGPITNSVPKP